MILVGLIVALLGIALIMLGTIAAARKVFKDEGEGFGAQKKTGFDFEGLAKVITAILTAPSWLLMVLAGGALVVVGVQIASGGRPFM
jgi:uncharacterized membrane protein